MCCHISKHHDSRQSHVPLAVPNIVNDCSHSTSIHYQLGKLCVCVRGGLLSVSLIVEVVIPLVCV